RPVDDWPGFAPGDRGVLNTMAPTHFRIADLSSVDPKPPVLWVRGADDVIVSDTSLYDLAYLGSLGAIPGWPGEQTWPPQPMVAISAPVRIRLRSPCRTVTPGRATDPADELHTTRFFRCHRGLIATSPPLRVSLWYAFARGFNWIVSAASRPLRMGRCAVGH